jgi:hypothetical protein
MTTFATTMATYLGLAKTALNQTTLASTSLPTPTAAGLFST